jgi:hypothetical protein
VRSLYQVEPGQTDSAPKDPEDKDGEDTPLAPDLGISGVDLEQDYRTIRSVKPRPSIGEPVTLATAQTLCRPAPAALEPGVCSDHAWTSGARHVTFLRFGPTYSPLSPNVSRYRPRAANTMLRITKVGAYNAFAIHNSG